MVSRQRLRQVLSTCLIFERLGVRFAVEQLKIDGLKAGIVKSTWLPRVSNNAIAPAEAEALAGMSLAGMTLGISLGALNVSSEWNRVFSDDEFVQPR